MALGRKPLYIFGYPSFIGGADTKLAHLIDLLREHFSITVVPNEAALLKEEHWTQYMDQRGARYCLFDELPKKLSGIGLSLCNSRFFADSIAHRAKERGLKIIWSSEMMWHHEGELEGVKSGVIDKVLYVSDLQKKYLAPGYGTLPSMVTGNFVNPDEFPFKDRRHSTFAIGRLSRADPAKYPEDFPVFYERLELPDVRYRVMAWSEELAKKYAWHRFGSEWDLLKEAQEPQADFLHSIDLFVYPLGQFFKESWGRSTVEAMLTGCIPLVPPGHHLDNLVKDGVNGFICHDFKDYQERARQLHFDYPLRKQLSWQARDYTLKNFCDKAAHLELWLKALE